MSHWISETGKMDRWVGTPTEAILEHVHCTNCGLGMMTRLVRRSMTDPRIICDDCTIKQGVKQ